MLSRNRRGKPTFNKSVAIGLVVFLLFISITLVSGFLNNVVNKTSKINDYKLIGEEVLGTNKPTRVLVLFENNAEARPGGGFIGTVGYINIDKGKIKPEPVRSVYWYDYQIGEIREALKSDGQDVSGINYTLRDSGQSLDWTTNAKAAIKLFELQPGKEVDMVVGVTPEVLKYFIRQTGPVKLDEYKKTITSDNIIETLQQEVESGQDKAQGKDPKTILSSVANVLLQRLSQKNLSELAELGNGLKDLTSQRQIMVYSKDYAVGESLAKLNLNGALVSFEADYFLLTENNNSIDKSNAFIDRRLARNISIDDDGKTHVETIITRTQTIPESFPYVDPKAPDVVTHLVRKNVSQIKFAIPSGSKILGTAGNLTLIPVGKEGGYDVYSFVSSLDPLVASEYRINYELPFVLSGESGVAYNSYIQIQNGGWPYQLSMSVQTPKNWEFSASNNLDVTAKGQTVLYNGDIDRDFYLSLIYAKN